MTQRKLQSVMGIVLMLAALLLVVTAVHFDLQHGFSDFTRPSTWFYGLAGTGYGSYVLGAILALRAL